VSKEGLLFAHYGKNKIKTVLRWATGVTQSLPIIWHPWLRLISRRHSPVMAVRQVMMGPWGQSGARQQRMGKIASTGIGQLPGEVAPARAPSVSTRSRIQRVPLTIGVMGDVERVSLNLILYYVYMLLHSDVIGATEHKTEWITAGSEELIPRQVKVNLKIYVFNIYNTRIYILEYTYRIHLYANTGTCLYICM
jgi:hypothetical protein